MRDDGFGLTAMFVVPGGGEMMLYEPRHPTAYDMDVELAHPFGTVGAPASPASPSR